MEKSLDNVTKQQLIEKLKNMSTFVVMCAAGSGMNENYIKSNFEGTEVKGDVTFNVDEQFGIKVVSGKCMVYRDSKGKILMIESTNFKVEC